jgi:predicted RNase H-like nuclease (RuvC/YqgF family)
MPSATVFMAIAALALGSGGGGIVGAIIMFRRFRLEQSESSTKQTVGLKEVEVAQFEALFPGGLGDALKHWKEEALELYDVVDKLRKEHEATKKELAVTQIELRVCRRDLTRATRRIRHLEEEAEKAHDGSTRNDGSPEVGEPGVAR